MTRIANNSKVLRYEVIVMRGDTTLAVGTIKEVSAQLGVNPETIRFYLTGAYARRLEKAKNLDNRITVTRTDTDDEDDL